MQGRPGRKQKENGRGRKKQESFPEIQTVLSIRCISHHRLRGTTLLLLLICVMKKEEVPFPPPFSLPRLRGETGSVQFLSLLSFLCSSHATKVEQTFLCVCLHSKESKAYFFRENSIYRRRERDRDCQCPIYSDKVFFVYLICFDVWSRSYMFFSLRSSLLTSALDST